VHETTDLLERAAATKARHRLSVADAWIAGSAEPTAAILVHEDPEFDALRVDQERLPAG
jgi:ribonuclease VapC